VRTPSLTTQLISNTTEEAATSFTGAELEFINKTKNHEHNGCTSDAHSGTLAMVDRMERRIEDREVIINVDDA